MSIVTDSGAIMLKCNPKVSWNGVDRMPTVSSTAYLQRLLARSALEHEFYVAPCVSLRADATHMIIGNECNIQDCVVIHGLLGSSIELGERISIAHGAIHPWPHTDK